MLICVVGFSIILGSQIIYPLLFLFSPPRFYNRVSVMLAIFGLIPQHSMLLKNVPENREEFLVVKKTPFTLSHLCRLTFRNCVKQLSDSNINDPLLKIVLKLKLPHTIILYLMFLIIDPILSTPSDSVTPEIFFRGSLEDQHCLFDYFDKKF